jgi:hypothetical protein
MPNKNKFFSCYFSSIDKEIKEINREVRSFKKFISEVDKIETKNDSPPKQVMNLSNRDSDKNENEIAQAYRDTVMQLSHHEREYGNHWKIDIKKEFGPDIANYTINLNRVTPNMKDIVITAATNSHKRRSHTISTFKKEKKLLHEYQRKLQSIEPNIGLPSSEVEWNNLLDQIESPNKVVNKCECIIKQRQIEIQQHNKSTIHLDNGEIESYLYSDCDHTYPVLSISIRYIKQIKSKYNDSIDN